MLAVSMIAGLALLLVGGDVLVRGAVGVAERAGLPPAVIGLTLVGFGTSTPELLTSVQGALAGAPGIAIGNVVGSNIANILLILGAAALIRPVAVDPAAFRRDATVLALVTLAAIGVCLTGTVGRPAGAVFIIGLGVFLYIAVTASRPAEVATYTDEADLAPTPPSRLWLALALFAAGLVGVVLGARLLVDGAVTLAAMLGMSETVIGLTIVAIGTSLPELVTSVTAALRGESGVALGNVVGSNIFNILGILGTTALVSPLPVPAEVIARDLWIMAAATLALIAAAVTGHRVSRGEGAGGLVLFALYLGALVMTA